MTSASKATTAETRVNAGADLRRMRRPPTHPGEVFLEEFVKPSGRSVRELAAHMGMSNNRLSEITRELRSVTAETALLFAAVTGTSPEFWLNLQTYHDLWKAMQKTKTSKIQPLLKSA